MKIPLFTQDGSKKGELDVPEEIFGQEVHKALIHKMLLLQLANRRAPIAHTLTKGEVRGGGIKPYKQKHTGRARQGSITNPHYIGGGIAFGPRNTRNFEIRATKKERRKALFATLSSKANDGAIAALENFSTPKPQTKVFAAMLKALPFEKKVLFVLPAKNEMIERSCRNISRVKAILVNYLNVADLLSYQNVLFLKEAVEKLPDIFKTTI